MLTHKKLSKISVQVLKESSSMVFASFGLFSSRAVVAAVAAELIVGGGLSGYVKSKPLGNGQIISIDVLVVVMIIAVFHEKLI